MQVTQDRVGTAHESLYRSEMQCQRLCPPYKGVLSIPYLHISPRRVLDRLELAAAGLARRHLLRALLLEPGQPVRPPGARMLLGLGEPILDLAARQPLQPDPVLIL